MIKIHFNRKCMLDKQLPSIKTDTFAVMMWRARFERDY
jgi:hypothetical protein